jgi:hypothetical protein
MPSCTERHSARLRLFRALSANVMLSCTTLSAAYCPPVLLNAASAHAALLPESLAQGQPSARLVERDSGVVDSNTPNRRRLAYLCHPTVSVGPGLIDRLEDHQCRYAAGTNG